MVVDAELGVVDAEFGVVVDTNELLQVVCCNVAEGHDIDRVSEGGGDGVRRASLKLAICNNH